MTTGLRRNYVAIWLEANVLRGVRARPASCSFVVDIGYFFDEMDQTIKSESPARLSRQKSKRLPRKPPKSEDPLHKRETLEFVRAYYRIKDPKIRGYVRKLIQTTASASSRST